MIENIRKYTGLMIVVLVLLFVGLVFLGDNVGNTFAGKPVMEVDGKSISRKDFQRNAVDVQNIATQIPNLDPLPRESRILASRYLGEEIIDNPYVLPGNIIQQMGMFLQPSDGLPDRFLANRLAVQKAGIEYGVTPSDDEVESFVENVLFADEKGNFNQEASASFFDKTAGKLGIGTRGFNEYIRDLMTAQNLSKLIGGGIAPEMETVRSLYDSAKQSVSVKQISLDAMTYETEINPTEEEIKAHYETNKSTYNSEEQRRISYLFVEPDWDQALAAATTKREEAAKKAEEEKMKRDAEKTIADEAAKKANDEKEAQDQPDETPPTETPAPIDEPSGQPAPSEEGPQGQTGEPGEPAPAAEPAPVQEAPPIEVTEQAEEAPAVAPAPVEESTETPPAQPEPVVAPEPQPVAPTVEQRPQDKLTPTERKEAVDALNPDLTAFYDSIIDKMGKNFDKIAADHGFEIRQTEMFMQSEAPEALLKAVSNAAIGTLADAVFQLPVEGDLDEKITPPYETQDGWFVGRLDEAVTSVPLTFEQAKVRVTVDLKKKLAREMMVTKAKELRDELAVAVEEGKSFEDIAKEKELTVQTLPDLQGSQSFQGRTFPAPPAFQAAQYTDPGKVAPVEFSPSEENPERALIVLVEKREIVKDDNYNTGLENAFKGQSTIIRYIAFQNWLYDQYIANNVKLFASE